MIRILIAGIAIFTPLLAQAPLPPAPSPMSSIEERLVVAEMSKARMDPRGYAEWLKTLLPAFEGLVWNLPEKVPLHTEEGAAALEELIAFLRKAPSLGPLRWSEGLSRAARQLVAEQGPAGRVGYAGPTNATLQSRALRHGLHLSKLGEVIYYGPETARWIVAHLLIDDGLPSRAHRKAIFHQDFHVAGAAAGPHAEFGEMLVVDFADGFVDNPGTK